MILRPTPTTTALFGPGVQTYAALVNGVAAGISHEPYEFIDDGAFEDAVRRGGLNQAAIGRIIWSELLQRARLAATLSMIRTASWIEASARERQLGAFAPFAACCRALLEAAGDSCDALNFVALTLAEHSVQIRQELSGNGGGATSLELEEVLIHFTHARHIPKGVNAPTSHKAKKTGDYLDVLSSMGLPAAKAFYGALCERMHPAQPGLTYYYRTKKDGTFTLTLDGEAAALDDFVDEYGETLREILPLALNPALLTLRVCGAFGLWSISPTLESANFDAIPVWARIKTALKLASQN